MRFRRARLSVIAATIFVATTAAAQPHVDDATRSSARRLGDEANALFDAGNYAGALEKYERVDALVHLPAVGLRAARCLVKLGRLVEASERYLAVTRIQLAPDALPVHREAQTQAETERAALQPRIPSVVINVTGAPQADVTIDGKPVPSALWGAPRSIDPGSHKIEARRGTEVQAREIKLGEGDSANVALAFTGDAKPASPAIAPSDYAPSNQGSSRGTYRTLGFVGLAAGAVGVGIGAATGLSAMSKKSDLEAPDACGADLRCPTARQSDADSYNGLRHLSTAGFVVGGLLAATGAVLLIGAPEGSRAPSARISPWVGGDSVGVVGAF